MVQFLSGRSLIKCPLFPYHLTFKWLRSSRSWLLAKLCLRVKSAKSRITGLYPKLSSFVSLNQITPDTKLILRELK